MRVLMLFQLAAMHSGMRKVVSSTNSTLMPSTPIR